LNVQITAAISHPGPLTVYSNPAFAPSLVVILSY